MGQSQISKIALHPLLKLGECQTGKVSRKLFGTDFEQEG